MEHSGSGEEVTWSGEEESGSSQNAKAGAGVPAKATEANAEGKTAAGSTADASPQVKQASKGSDGNKDVAPDNMPPADGESEISWRGTRTGPAPNCVNADGEPIYDPLKDLELATAKVAEVAGQAAMKVSTKLVDKASAARRSLSHDAEISKHWNSIRDSASKAGTNITKLADNMSSWWANLDPIQNASPSPEDDGCQSSSAQGGVDVNKLFGLLQEEELMESFEVELRQAYSCNHNTLSKPQEIDFPGKMYITDRHTCFAASSGSVSFSLPHKAKQTVKKLLQGVGSGAYEVLLIAFGEKEHVVFTGFRADDLNSALALLEHLTSTE
ncbi:g3544 [Coccomyxa viridis]|uniref:G3544 protein n=1 Tax=Coccomyxa viridis TaxID=1274662 RepID=A0ABP1FN14_9CHLO